LQKRVLLAKRIFVTATNTDIGKTYTTKLLLKEYASRGFRVGVIKPIETGVVDSLYPDGSALLALTQELNPAFKNLTVADIVPISFELPAAPFVASNGARIDLDFIEKSIQKIELLCDVLVIEGAGGLYVPIDENLMMIDLIKASHARALLVTHCALGCINDTLLSQRALEEKSIPHATAFNCRESDENFSCVSEPYFLKRGQKVLKVKNDIDTICDVLYNL
jgi:dethiobiotin synthetase